MSHWPELGLGPSPKGEGCSCGRAGRWWGVGLGMAGTSPVSRSACSLLQELVSVLPGNPGCPGSEVVKGQSLVRQWVMDSLHV